MKVNPYKEKLPFDDIETLHECFDCEGCLCKDLCKKYEDEFEENSRTIEDDYIYGPLYKNHKTERR